MKGSISEFVDMYDRNSLWRRWQWLGAYVENQRNQRGCAFLFLNTREIQDQPQFWAIPMVYPTTLTFNFQPNPMSNFISISTEGSS
ncbi:hypothetical protein EV2_038976 [Malus domestica]